MAGYSETVTTAAAPSSVFWIPMTEVSPAKRFATHGATTSVDGAERSEAT